MAGKRSWLGNKRPTSPNAVGRRRSLFEPLEPRLVMAAPVLTQNYTEPVDYARDAAVGVPILRGALDPHPLATLFDADSPDFSGGVFQVDTTAGANAGDRVVVSGNFSISGSDLLRKTTKIGAVVSNGAGGTSLTVNLNASANPTNVGELANSIRFLTIGGMQGKRAFAFSVSDGDGGTSNVVSRTVNVWPESVTLNYNGDPAVRFPTKIYEFAAPIDLSNADGFGLEAYNPSDEPVRLAVSLLNNLADDSAHSHLFMQTLQPKAHTKLGASFKATDLKVFGLPFTESDIEPMNNFRSNADLTNIVGVSLFLDVPTVAVSVQMKNFRLLQHIPLDTPIIDKYGQYTRQEWDGKVHNDAELGQLIQADIAERQATLPEPNRDAYGGVTNSNISFGGAVPAGGTGHFTTAKDTTGRWWLVSPLGNPFFAVGVNAPAPAGGSDVASRPELFEPVAPLNGAGVYDFYQANLQRYNAIEGAGASWQKRTIDRLQNWGFNSVGNWPDETLTVDVPGAPRFPYMRTVQSQRLRLMPAAQDGAAQPATLDFPGTNYAGPVFYTNDGLDAFVDVFSTQFQNYVLQDTVTTPTGPIPGFFATPEVARTDSDPYAIGFFVDNEIRWTGDEREDRKALPRAALNSVGSAVRTQFLQNLAQKYSSIGSLLIAWEATLTPGVPAATAVTAIGNATFTFPAVLNATAKADLEDLLGVYANKYYQTVHDGFRAHLPHKLYLGSRLYEGEASPGVLAALAQYADVISLNYYRKPEQLASTNWSAFAAVNKPLLIGEFGHIGMDVGNFVGRGDQRDVATQADRGALYQQYMDLIASNPLFVGASVFTYHDQVAAGREIDYENLNVGLVDILDLPNTEYVDRVGQWNREKYAKVLGTDPVNHAPVLTIASTPAMTPIAEDDVTNTGTAVHTLLAGTTDSDPIAHRGVAVTSLNNTAQGTWQYTLDGGQSWYDFGATSATAARLLPDSGEVSRIRFLPNADFVGQVSLTLRAWDQTQGYQRRTFTVGAGGGATPFSANEATVTLNVTAVQDAPTLDPAVLSALNAMGQGTTNTAGTPITNIVGGITDPDANAKKGIAIVALTGTGNGTWQYTLDDGVTWLNMGTIAMTGALQLPADGTKARVRYQPVATFSGNVQIDYFAWDTTQGAAGTKVDLTNSDNLGGTFAYSTKRRSSPLRVNNAPVLDTGAAITPASAAEDNFTPPGFSVQTLAGGVTDDVNALAGIAVTSLGGTTNGKWQYTLDSGTTWIDFGTISASTARLLAANGETNRIRFIPNANFNGPVPISYRAWDRTQGASGGTIDLTPAGSTGGFTSFSSATRTTNVNVSPVNDAPVVVFSNPAVPSIAEDIPTTSNTGVLVSSLLGNVTDIDGGGAQGIAVYSLSGKVSGAWQYSLDNGVTWTAIGDPTTSAALLLASANRVRFVPNANFNGTVNLYFYAWDRSNGLVAGSRTSVVGKLGGINPFSLNGDVAKLTVTAVNDAPTLFISGNIDYLRDSAAVVLSATAGLDDVDSTNIKSVKVRISDGAGATNRLLIGGGFSSASGQVKQGTTVIGTLNANGGVGTTDLIVTFTNPVAKTVARDLIRGISFQTVSGVAGTRKVLFSATDPSGATSAEAFKTVNVLANAAPKLTFSNPALTSVAEDTPAASNTGSLVSSLLVGLSDPDGPAQGIAVYAISGKVSGAWQYSLNGTTWVAIGDPTESAALLLLSTNRVRFLPNANFNGIVNITYRAWDRSDNLAAGSITSVVGKTGGTFPYSSGNDVGKLTITAVNDAPTLFISGSMNYVHDSAQVAIAPTAGLDDVDSANIKTLTISITTGAAASNRLIVAGGFSVTGTQLKQGTTVIGSINTNGGVGTTNLVVTFTTPISKTIARDLLRGLNFKTVSGTAGDRKIIFTATDAEGTTSAEVFKTVKVT